MQEANESFDAFMTETRRLVKSCDYGVLEQSILKDRIVIGIRDDATRRKLLQIRKLDLTTAIDVCRASETAARHLQEMKGGEEVSKVSTAPTSSKKKYLPQREKSSERKYKPSDGSNQRRREGS